MYKLALSLSLILAPSWLSAQTAEDYFHGGAQYYIWGEKAKATNEIYTGLHKYPTDPLLNGLAQLLKKEEEKQQQNQQNQQNQDKKEQQNKEQENKQEQSQNKQDQNKDSQQKDQKEQAKKDQDKKEKQSAEQKSKEEQEAQKSSGKPGENDKQEGEQAYAAGQMTPQQAKQLLDAQKGQEMVLPVKPVGKPRDPSKPLKDW